MKETIHVTQAEIDRARAMIAAGHPQRAQCCPIALAVRRALDVEWAAVFEDEIEAGGGRVRLLRIDSLPFVATEFVYAFDDGESVQPFEFEVEWEETDRL